MKCAGPACTNDFEPKRSTARYCSATCRSRANRSRKAAEAAVEIDAAEAKAGDAEHELVTVTRRELVEAEVLDTVNGQLALNLARKLVDVDAKGVASLTKELRIVLAEAKAGSAVTPTTGGDDADGNEAEDDEVAQARKARAAARQAAGLA